MTARTPRSPRRFLCLMVAGVALALVGCQSATRPDPNDPANAMTTGADAIRANLDATYAELDQRVRRGELTPDERDRLLREHAAQFVPHINLEQLPVTDLWKFGEIFRTAGRWDLARAAYALALENATNDDRRVNDALKLALADVQLGKPDSALPLIRGTYTRAPGDKGAILPAVLLEIVPAAEAKGLTPEWAGKWAEVLTEAIRQHETVVVDAETPAGQAFIAAKPFHVRNAWIKAIRLYEQAGRADLAEKTREDAERDLSRFQSA